MKKIIALIAVLAIMVGATVMAFSADYYGDVDKNGTVNSNDALEILKYSVGLIEEIDTVRADVTKDGRVDSVDALLVLQISVGALKKQEIETSTKNQVDPLSYTKEQIVDYYNNCLTNAYEQPMFTVTKTEKVDAEVSEIKVNGKSSDKLQSMINGIIEKKAVARQDKQSFTNKNAVVDEKNRFILPAKLTPAGAKSATIAKNGAGYVINITLVSENCDFKTKPPYNSSCTFPLDFTEIDVGDIGKITSAQFYYPSTTLTATIDSLGRVVQTKVVMPLMVDNALGEGFGHELCMDISGCWYCTTINSFLVN